MQSEVCLDANIFVSAVIAEPSQNISLKLFQTLEDKGTHLFEPALVTFEVTSALQQKVVEQVLSADDAEKAMTLFGQLPLFLQWQTFVLQKSLQLAQQLNFKKTYDAAYLAVAVIRNIPLVTLDPDFHKKAKQAYHHVYLVEEFLKEM